MKKIVLVFFVLGLFGCKSSEDKLLDACQDKLDAELATWAKYDGWDTSKAERHLYKMDKNVELNQKYKTDQFYDFEVLISNITVKNGYNADVKSIATCTGYVSKDSEGYFESPVSILMKVTLNGKKLGF